ncbi:MAG: cytochrome c oxidase subunit II [Flavobacteriaceae bacterium]|nr:cytochrome c oxidase subunit II [Flavobacteriaceae bacterium]
MTAILYILVFTIIAIGSWQAVKIFGLLKSNEIATEKENNINGWLMLGIMAFLYSLMIFSFYKYSKVLLPQLAASEEGLHIDKLFKITFILIFIVQFITQFLIFYFTFKYRGKDKSYKATFLTDNHKLEFFWTIIPAIVFSGLIIYGLWTWNLVTDITNKEDNPIYIELYSKQFQWEARYAGKDNILGEANIRNIKGINTMGVDMSDKNSQDDKAVLHEIYLPKGRKVVFQIRSQDVIHSAYMPHFRAQMNCVPGMKTYMGFTPSVTTEEMRNNEDTKIKVTNINKIRAVNSKKLIANGEDALEPYIFDYLLLCNKICGSSHYSMQMKIVVVEESEYNKWIASKKTLAQVIN